MDAIGDLARTLVLRSNQVRLREDMDRLAVEVATGFVKDSAKHLDGDLTGLMAIDRSLARLEAFRINTAEASFLTGTMQTTLEEIQSRSETLSQTLISAELSPTPALLDTMSGEAQQALAQILSGMNRSVAGRTLFGGTATDRPAVMEFDAMMTELRGAVTGLTEAPDIVAALDTFFATGGDYETTVYQGSNDGLAPLRLSETESANVDIRATDDAFKALLRPLAMSALAGDASLGLSLNVQIDLLTTAGRDLLAAQQPIVELRAGLGALEARVEESTTRNATERTATSLARLDLVGTDQYETATRYENVRSQLESLYAITARSQRLSLAEYL